MVVEINLKLIKPSKDLRLACFGYDNVCKTRKYASIAGLDGYLKLFSCISKEWELVLGPDTHYREMIDRIILKKQNSKDKQLLKSLEKVVKIKKYPEVEKILNKELVKYKEKTLPKVVPEFNKIYTPTKVNLVMFSVSSRTDYGGSATDQSYYLSADDLNKVNKCSKNNDNDYLITHELIHAINSNNSVYKNIEKRINSNRRSNKYSDFSEVFTETITNVVCYNAGLEKIKWRSYRYPQNRKACLFEDELRKHYESWNNIKTKNKPKFIEYLDKKLN